MIDKKKVRQRNLLVKLFNAYTQDNSVLTRSFTQDELRKQLYFKESDIIYNAMGILERDGNVFKLTENTVKKLLEFEQFRDKSKKELEANNSIETEFKGIYTKLKSYFAAYMQEKNIYENNMPRAIELAKILHWIYLPIYSEQMIENRGIIPENNLEDYYNHFHSIEDLYYEISGLGKKWNSIEGDINLNKELWFKVYTSRWGHHDNYRIKRTSDGWYVEHISINGPSKKNGEGALEANLEHDSVVYPKEGVQYALETLWNEADESEMNIEDLQYKLQQIADWISEVEKATHKYQPDWCGYY